MTYRPEDFLDLADFPHGAALFHGVKHVWEGVAALLGYIEKTIRPGIHGYVEEGAWLEPDGVFLGQGSRVERGAIIRGPAIIGNNTTIRSGAYLRGHTLIGDGCVIGFSVEMRQTMVMHQSRVPHFNAVFTSLIGRDVNLGGKVSTANFRLDGGEVFVRVPVKGETVSFPTGRTLFGAVVGDETNIGGDCLLLPATIIGRRCAIFPKCTLSGYIPHDSKVVAAEAPLIISRRQQAPPTS